jgi:gliding motility-associated-like protein
VIDSCFKAGQISNTAKTILLTVQNDDVRKLNYLNWSSYQDFDGSILGYNIYRGINGIFSGSPIDYVPTGQFSYEDDVNSVISIGKICYYVEAIEAINSFGFSEQSRSNESCIVQEPTIYIPNSFSPDGDEFNQIFLPILSDFDPTDYELKIYNRWGQPIFISNDPSIGWNGIVKETNQIAASGTYLYSVTLIDGNGIEIFKKGHVNLFK